MKILKNYNNSTVDIHEVQLIIPVELEDDEDKDYVTLAYENCLQMWAYNFS